MTKTGWDKHRKTSQRDRFLADDSDFSGDESGSDSENRVGGGAGFGSDASAGDSDSDSIAADALASHAAQREDAEQAAERARGGVLHSVEWYLLRSMLV